FHLESGTDQQLLPLSEGMIMADRPIDFRRRFFVSPGLPQKVSQRDACRVTRRVHRQSEPVTVFSFLGGAIQWPFGQRLSYGRRNSVLDSLTPRHQAGNGLRR